MQQRGPTTQGTWRVPRNVPKQEGVPRDQVMDTQHADGHYTSRATTTLQGRPSSSRQHSRCTKATGSIRPKWRVQPPKGQDSGGSEPCSRGGHQHVAREVFTQIL